MGRPELALEEVNRALATQPDDPGLHQAAAASYMRLGYPNAACNAMRRVIALLPNGDRGYGLLSLYLLQANKPHEAQQAARRATMISPEHPGWVRHLAEALRLCGEPVEALEHAQRAAALHPEWGEHTLGRVLLLHGRWREAEATLTRATAATPAWPGGPLYLALALVPQGRLDEALGHLGTAMHNNPREDGVPPFCSRLEGWKRRETLLRKQAGRSASRTAALAELAELLVEQDRSDEAVRTLDVLLEEALDSNIDGGRLSEARRWQQRRRDAETEPRTGIFRMELEVLEEIAKLADEREEAAGLAQSGGDP